MLSPNGDQSISLAYDSLWLVFQSFNNPFLMNYIILAAFTNFLRTFTCSKYIVILDRISTRILFIQMMRSSSKIYDYMLLFITMNSYMYLKIFTNKKNKNFYHHNFHYWGYISLSCLNNEDIFNIIISSIIYWIGVYGNKSKISAFFPLSNIFYKMLLKL